MQEEPQTQRTRKTREISFSEPLQNYETEENSRTSSPSIAIQDITSLIEKERNINATPLYNQHYKYLQTHQKILYLGQHSEDKKDFEVTRRYQENQTRHLINSKDTPINKPVNLEKRKGLNICRHKLEASKENIINTPKRVNGHSNIKIKGYCQQTSRNSGRTPLKEKEQNNSNKSINFQSNMSSIKDQNSSTLLKLKDSSLMLHLKEKNISNQDYQTLSPSAYHLLSERYLNYSASKTKRNGQKQRSLVKGKDVDSEIIKLQMKLQALQNVKKQMNIDFKASNTMLTQSTSSKLTNRTSITDSLNHLDRQDIQTKHREDQMIKSSKTTEEGLITSQIITVRSRVNQENVHMPKLLRNVSAKKKLTVKQVGPIEKHRQSNFQCRENGELQIKTITQCRQTLQKSSIHSTINKFTSKIAAPKNNSELKRLLLSLQDQIKLDDKLRKTKKWFQRWRFDLKWQNLQTILEKNGHQINAKSIKQNFSISSQEQNPFYTPRQSDFSLINLIQNYEEAERHWKQHILGKYSSQGLTQASFIEQKLDISKRGTINIQDLVRYINYQLDSFYRNRDIFLIFHRFKQQQSLYFTDILQNLTNPIQ